MKTPLPLLFLALPAAVLGQGETMDDSLRPLTVLENMAASDGSVQRCVLVATVPGVRYTFQTSPDLSGWTDGDVAYGLGQDFVASMLMVSPPPPPPDPQNPPEPEPPPAYATITVRASSGSAGGTVVEWPSLDHGHAVRHLIPTVMGSEWDTVPMYADVHGDHYFTISRPGVAVAPPEETALLGEKDTAMIEDLENHWADISLALATSAATARNTPPPPPAEAGDNGFMRVKADWGLDSDGDGITDPAEFALAANGPAADGLSGSAFDGDTNRDGIPDGQQLDSDGDGVNDAFDAMPRDGRIGFTIIPVARYAIFEFDDPNSEAFMISDKGTVLMPNDTWKAGVRRGIIGLETRGDHANTAISINDNDVILGQRRLPQDVFRTTWWDGPTGAPTQVSASGFTGVYAAYPGEPHWFLGTPFLGNDGAFIGNGFKGSGNDYEESNESLWQLPANGQPASIGGSYPGMLYHVSPDIFWGYGDYSQPRDHIAELISGGQTHELFYVPHKVVKATFGEKSTLFVMGEGFLDSTHILADGQWSTSPDYINAADTALDGTAISKFNQTPRVELAIMQNGKWASLPRSAPGLPSSWYPSLSASFKDISPRGWILASDYSAGKSAALLPVRIQGAPGPGQFELATGVDNTSASSNFGAKTPEEDFLWIRGGVGAKATPVRFDVPVDADSAVEISATGLTFDDGPIALLDKATSIYSVTTPLPVPSGVDYALQMKTGDEISTSTPVKVFPMAARVLHVHLHEVVKKKAGHPDDAPDLVPTKAELEAHLNSIYDPQLNLTFIVTKVPAPIAVDWDTGPVDDAMAYDGGSGDNVSTEQENILLNTPQASKGDIDIYLMGGPKRLGTGLTDWATGVTSRTRRCAWIVADPFRGRTLEEVKDTIAHEIGHVLCGFGHPDEGDGLAPFPDTDLTLRLMCSGAIMTKPRGVLLVYAEWCKAEEWLRQFFVNQNP